jgi:3-phosphoshikimate 1-carboxyvinyltransferase
MQPQARALAVELSGVARGELRAPGSKSIAQRALVLAALAHGTTRLAGLPSGDDVAAAQRFVREAGVELATPTPATANLVGRPPAWRGGWRATRVEVGESGTLARLAIATTALCSQAGSHIEVHARGTLLARRTDALLDALESSGVAFESREWPLRFVAIGPATTIVLANPASSQEASALAAALASYPDENELVIEGALPSRPYFDMTRALLERFGARLECVEHSPRERWRIRGPLRAPEDPLAIEPDASLAAVALGAACLSGGEVLALGLHRDSLQGDVRIAEHLRAFGCRAHFAPRGLVASGFPQHGVELDLAGEPDLAPVLAPLAAGAALVAPPGRTRSSLRGLETLNRKESRRLDVLAGSFARAGWSIEHDGSSLTIDAPRATLSHNELRLDPHGDHRMAFAFALLGQLRAGIVIEHSECVAKSWPSCWRELGALGLRFTPRE